MMWVRVKICLCCICEDVSIMVIVAALGGEKHKLEKKKEALDRDLPSLKQIHEALELKNTVGSLSI